MIKQITNKKLRKNHVEKKTNVEWSKIWTNIFYRLKQHWSVLSTIADLSTKMQGSILSINIFSTKVVFNQ